MFVKLKKESKRRQKWLELCSTRSYIS